MGCNCGKPKCDGHCGVSPTVLQINNPSECVLFHRVEVPASMGDSKTNPPKSGAYKNVLLYYEADQTSWLYSSDGIPQKLVNGLTDYEDAINLPQINGVTLIGDKNSAGLKLADAPMVITIATGNTSWSGADTAEDIYNFFLNQGKVNVVFEGSENYGYEIVSAAYIPGEQKMMCMTTVASADTGSSPVEFSSSALYGLMTFYTVDKAVDVGEIDLQPKLFITDFTGLNMTDGYVLEGVPATSSSIGMVKPGDGLEVASDGTLTVIDHVFDTVADMKNAANLIAGSYAQTLGFHTLNDGGGATYFISDTGTANEKDVISVGSLYANLVVPAELKPEMVGAYGDGVADDTSYFAKAVEIATNVICNKTYKISSITIPNSKKIYGLGTLIPTSVTVGADTIIKDLSIDVGENTTAFTINNLASTSNNNDVFDSLTFNCESGATCFHIYPQHTNSGLYNVRFNNISAKGNYQYFVHITNNSKWITSISLNNIYCGSPVNMMLIDNNVNNASYCGVAMYNVKTQANSHTEHYIVCDACNVQMRACNADELQDFDYRLIYIRNDKANILVDGISNAAKLVGSSLYNDYTALASNITMTPTLTQVQANRFNQTTLTEVSNAGTCDGNLVLGVASMSGLNINSKRIFGIQVTPGNRIATDGRSFLLGVDKDGIPYYASVSGDEYHEIPYTGKLKTYSTSNRPATANNGDCIFDTTLKQPIYWYGRWLKYDGTNA